MLAVHTIRRLTLAATLLATACTADVESMAVEEKSGINAPPQTYSTFTGTSGVTLGVSRFGNSSEQSLNVTKISGNAAAPAGSFGITCTNSECTSKRIPVAGWTLVEITEDLIRFEKGSLSFCARNARSAAVC